MTEQQNLIQELRESEIAEKEERKQLFSSFFETQKLLLDAVKKNNEILEEISKERQSKRSVNSMHSCHHPKMSNVKVLQTNSCNLMDDIHIISSAPTDAKRANSVNTVKPKIMIIKKEYK